MKKIENESFLQFVERATDAMVARQIGYDEWANVVVGENLYSDETMRRIVNFFVKFLEKLSDEDVKALKGEEILARIEEAKRELEEEKIKVQTENIQYSQNMRAEARHKLFNEKIEQSISRLKPFEVKNIKKTNSIGSSGLLCVYDLHAGSTYEIRGVFNEVVNKYDFEIMQNRLWYLLGQMKSSSISYDDLTIVFGGDLVENILRMSSLTKLKEPVVDTVIRLGEFLSTWVSKVYETLEIPVNVVVIGGNHDNARFLQSKPTFEEENLAKIVCEFMKLRLSNIDNIKVDDYTDVAIKTIRKTNIMFEHGEADAITTMDYFSNLYNIPIDEGYFGHLHRQESKSAGIGDVGDRMVYRVGSVAGVDIFAKKLRKASRASVLFATYTDDGHDWTKTYYLN